MAYLIHIVGAQGVGKTQLALHIIAGMAQSRKTAISLVEEGLQCGGWRRDSEVAALRTEPIRRAGEKLARDYDAVIVEHQEEPKPQYLQPGDLVIRMERVQPC